MRKIRSPAVVATLLVGFAAISADAEPVVYELPNETAEFRPGPGVEAAERNCSACHSADYVNTQPPRRDKAFWQVEVTKMIKAYGAPIADDDANEIVEYLTATY